MAEETFTPEELKFIQAHLRVRGFLDLAPGKFTPARDPEWDAQFRLVQWVPSVGEGYPSGYKVRMWAHRTWDQLCRSCTDTLVQAMLAAALAAPKPDSRLHRPEVLR